MSLTTNTATALRPVTLDCSSRHTGHYIEHNTGLIQTNGLADDLVSPLPSPLFPPRLETSPHVPWNPLTPPLRVSHHFRNRSGDICPCLELPRKRKGGGWHTAGGGRGEKQGRSQWKRNGDGTSGDVALSGRGRNVWRWFFLPFLIRTLIHPPNT